MAVAVLHVLLVRLVGLADAFRDIRPHRLVLLALRRGLIVGAATRRDGRVGGSQLSADGEVGTLGRLLGAAQLGDGGVMLAAAFLLPAAHVGLAAVGPPAARAAAASGLVGHIAIVGLARVQQVMMWAVDARPLVAGLLARAGARFQVLVLRGGRGRAAPSRCLAGPLGEAGLELLRLQGRVRLLLEVDLRASLLGGNALVNLYVWIPTC